MLALQRMTTDYIAHEDRIRITGECADGRVVVLWLTQRLLARLVPLLCRWLEGVAHPGKPASPAQRLGAAVAQQAAVQGFAQELARAQLVPQAPVPADRAAQQFVVDSVQLTSHAQAVRLVFKPALDAGAALGGTAVEGTVTDEVTLTLSQQQLRQWLDVLHAQCRLAAWPDGVWPAWVQQAHPSAPAGARGATLH